jgi:hypothetical protein
LALVCNESRDSRYGLLKPCGSGNKIEIDPASGQNPLRIKRFRSLGRILGMAIVNHATVAMPLPMAYYKLLLKKHIDVQDVEEFDAELYQKLTNTM